MQPHLLCLLLALLPVSVARSKEFAKVHKIKGVSKVEFLEPYLLVRINSRSKIKVTREQVNAIIENETDPDVIALTKPFGIRIYDRPSYAVHRNEFFSIKSINSAKKLRIYYTECLSMSVYEMNWEADEIAQSRKLYLKDNVRYRESNFEKEKDRVFRHIEKLKGTNKRPERILCINASFLGILIYPVFNGQIRMNGVDIPWEDFAPILDMKKVHRIIY